MSASNFIAEAIEATTKSLEENTDAHWILGFSGGKDSTALLKIFTQAAANARQLPAKIDLIYCDTGVENPILDRYVKKLFLRLKQEFLDTNAPFRTVILKAPVAERFFVRIIGRGYPPPTNSFRWCTKGLRISPVSRYIKAAAEGNAIVSLGMRRGESQQRDRSLLKSGDDMWQTQREGKVRYRMFLPIIDFDVPEVWEVIFKLPQPYSIDANSLNKLYRGASGECPIIKSPLAPPCGSGRFGCWTCTVVRKDKSAIALIDAGYKELKPYLEFRNWLAEVRNDPERRWKKRRNGSSGLGPFTLKARREILSRLESLELETRVKILSAEERTQINQLWALDHGVEQLV